MAETHDFEKLRKKRRRGILLRRIAVLFAISLAVMGVLSLNNLLVSFGSAGTMSDFLRGFGGGGYPIEAPGGSLRDVREVNGDIAIINDTNLYIYNDRGKEMLNIQHPGENAILLAGGGRVMTYAVGETGYRIYSRSTQLLDETGKYPLTAAAMGETGNYALVSATRQYAAQVTVYDVKFEQVFQWSSSELVAGVALGPGGKMMAAGCVGASGGIISSSVQLFSFDQKSAVARLDIPGELIAMIEFLSDSLLGILTDKGFHVMDGSGKITATTSFGGESLKAERTDGYGDVLILTESAGSRTQTVRLIDSSGEERGRFHPEAWVLDMQLGGREIYFLTVEGIICCDRELKPVMTIESGGASRILAAGGRVYYFNPEEIGVLERKEVEP
ncbi:MAG: DUF5711 family protein [Oscillospiraceae bacterium]|jgi:hypothetical protein|nr:DUF5711 family protein [Oscillospiraceae bacterium]